MSLWVENQLRDEVTKTGEEVTRLTILLAHRDAEIARLNDHIERLSLDLALKETDQRSVIK